jgi:hypothetical protein
LLRGSRSGVISAGPAGSGQFVRGGCGERLAQALPSIPRGGLRCQLYAFLGNNLLDPPTRKEQDGDEGSNEPTFYDTACAVAGDVSGGGRDVLIGIVLHSDEGNLHGYLDESLSGDTVLCSAGYLFERKGAKVFCEKWRPFLQDHGLKFFHATDCFRRPDWEEISSLLVNLIKETAFRWFVRFMQSNVAASVQSELRKFTGSDYSICTLSCMENMASVAKARNQEIVYFIEDGHKFAGELRHFLNLIKDDPERKEHFAMAGADTYSKEKVIQLQAADLLAWEFGRSTYREAFSYNIQALINGKDEPGNPGHHVSGISDIGASIYGMMNSFYGFHSNLKRFKG